MNDRLIDCLKDKIIVALYSICRIFSGGISWGKYLQIIVIKATWTYLYSE